MMPDYAKFAIVLKLGRWHKSIRIPKSKNKMARALPVNTKASLGFHLPPISHLLSRPFKTPLSVAAWSEVWPYSYVSCRTCATPTPLTVTSCLLFHIYGRHPPFKAVPSSVFLTQGSRSAALLLLRTRTTYPLPCARAFHSHTAVVIKTCYLYFTQSLRLFCWVILVHPRSCCPPTLHFLQPPDWCLMKASEVGEGAAWLLMYGAGDSTFTLN